MKKKNVITAAAAALMCAVLTCGVLSAQDNTAKNPAAQDVSVPADYRGAFIDVPSYVANNLKKGDRVDVLLTFSAVVDGGEPRPQNITATIFQNVLVLHSNGTQGASYIAVALSPRDAQNLFSAKNEGQVNVVKRNAEDKKINTLEVSSLQTFFSKKK